MTMFKRGMIFVTFFLSCLIIALLVAALGTKYWIVARARRISNPEESDGRINFGLFEGKKELNVAYGWRTYEIKSLVTFLSAPFKQFEILREKRLTDSS
ncbi:uncharacterized protein GBIM_08828 [Gryllus bimaculatus]|nr:uncharacterized protein GBIM_08828 [Gryllus bimaculatus]